MCHYPPVSKKRRSDTIPTAALRAFEGVEKKEDWSEGVPIGELLARVNAVADKLLADESGRDSRVSREFTLRSFRRYQTMGCIGAPARQGRTAVYGFGHFVQSLLVRKLLWQGMPAEMISDLAAERSVAEMRGMLFEKARPVTSQNRRGGGSSLWSRLSLGQGVELHLSADRPDLTSAQLDSMSESIRDLLRDHRVS